jgi:small-conductance mechanosensitive channel/CRP-like cAMP-binding protein
VEAGDEMTNPGGNPRAALLLPLIVTAAAWTTAAAWPGLAAMLDLPPESMLTRNGRSIALSLGILATAWLIIRVFDVLVWHGMVERRSGVPVPRLLVGLSHAIVWIAAGLLIFIWGFDLEVVGFVATSSVTIAVVGFALRDMIASLFAGTALSLERPYGIGDWIEVETGVVAKVLEIGWLTTRAVTRDGVGVVIPNARLATIIWRNYNRPDASWRDSIKVPLDYAVPPETAERLLLAAMHDVPEIAAHPRPPDVKVAEFGERGAVWLARYWVEDYAAMQDTRYHVQRAVMRQLEWAGLEIARPRLDTYLRRPPAKATDTPDHLCRLLAAQDLFHGLDEEGLLHLVQGARRRDCRAGAPIVSAGEPGASMFVVGEGLLHVSVPRADGELLRVNTLGPGAVFGEFSLLTGAPRSATVVPFVDSTIYEIGKAEIEPLIRESPDLAADLSRILAERQERSRALATTTHEAAESPRGTQQAILTRLRAFFGLVDSADDGKARARRRPAG